MSLSNMSFTNSCGTISMSRIMYTLNHRYTWKGSGVAREILAVTVNGWIKTTDADLLNNVMISDSLIATSGYYAGNVGTLTLPNNVYSDMYVKSVSYEEGYWNEWGKASVSFDNESPSDSLSTYAITWWGYTLYAPKITITPSTIKRSETTSHNMTGWYRQQLGHEMMKLTISGTYICPDTALPSGILSALEWQYSASGLSFPSGYPYVFDLTEAVPQAAGSLDIRKCVLLKGALEWHVNERFANVSLDIVAPPQTI